MKKYMYIIIGILLAYRLVLGIDRLLAKDLGPLHEGRLFVYRDKHRGSPMIDISSTSRKITEAIADFFNPLPAYNIRTGHIELVDARSYKGSTSYIKRLSKIYFYNGRLNEISNTDSTTFTGVTDTLSKDQNNVYIYSCAIPASDPASLKKNELFFFDQHAAYFPPNFTYSNKKPDCVEVVREYVRAANTAQIKFLKNSLWTDSVSVFYREKKLAVDLATLKILSNAFIQDKGGVYSLAGYPVEGVDLNTFRILGDFYAKDNYHVYYNPSGYETYVVDGIDSGSAGLVGKILRDELGVYQSESTGLGNYKAQVIPFLDVQSAQYLGGDYYQSGSDIYFNPQYWQSADEAKISSSELGFRFLGGEKFSIGVDRENVFVNKDTMTYRKLDVDSVEYLGGDRWRDKHYEYDGYSLIKTY